MISDHHERSSLESAVISIDSQILNTGTDIIITGFFFNFPDLKFNKVTKQKSYIKFSDVVVKERL